MKEALEVIRVVFTEIPWMQIALVFFGLYLAYLIIKFHRKPDNSYSVMDMVMSEGKADLYKHVVVIFAALSVWTVVWLATHDKPVETLLLGSLGIFVGSRLVNSVASTLSHGKADTFYEGAAPPATPAPTKPQPTEAPVPPQDQ